MELRKDHAHQNSCYVQKPFNLLIRCYNTSKEGFPPSPSFARFCESRISSLLFVEHWLTSNRVIGAAQTNHDQSLVSELNYSVGYSAPSRTFRVLILHFLLWMGRRSRFKGRLRARGGGGGGGYSQKNWVGVCGLLPKTLTLFITKIFDFPYPI